MTDSIDKKLDEEIPSEKSGAQSLYIELAKQFPNEYVVFIGSTIFYHSHDRTQAFAKYEESFKTATIDQPPSILQPRAELPQDPPITRGRRTSE